MKKNPALRLAAASLALVFGTTACNDENDVAGARGALAVLHVEAPSFAQSGEEFEVEVVSANVGVSNVRDGRVEVVFESPLMPLAADASSGTTASVAGDRATWTLDTLDANSRSTLRVRVVGRLAAGEASRSARIRAELTARGISAGEAVATEFVTIRP
jgi:hypothetical protein